MYRLINAGNNVSVTPCTRTVRRHAPAVGRISACCGASSEQARPCFWQTPPGRAGARSAALLLYTMPSPQAKGWSSHHRLPLTDNACVRVRGACRYLCFLDPIRLPFPKPVFFSGTRAGWLWPCSVQKKTPKFFKILRHIKSCGTCMEH